ncbi:sensor histidine kinase [Marinobacterium weihaiense]|uniref:histidine kinase n=1 Tax=Marinobacterium weihaiense TaxID=2851016 RepID=A0ABS6MB06_9GAMM|nr:sensor histidine kinase [Marinobacterium weihaiense]MBV0933464.1 sensor histidine kinase [Marinobacterium weihaiense]
MSLQPAAAPSLESRIRRQLLLVLLVVMTGLLTLIHFSVSQLTQAVVLSRLEHDAESLIAALEPDMSGRWTLATATLPQVYQRVHSGYYYQLLSAEFQQRSRSLWDLEPDLQPLPVGQQRHELRDGVGEQRWLVLEQGFSRGGQAFTLWVAEDIAELQQEQRRFELWLLLLLALSVPLMLVLQRGVLRAGFARLEPLRQALERQQAGDDPRFPDALPQEVMPLVQTLSQLLHRSGEQISRSRTALGNLAHELKRPLQELQWLAQQQQDPAVQEQLQRLYHQLFERIERELRRARIAGSPGPGRHFQPQDEIPHLEQLLLRIGRDDIRLDTRLPDGSIPFDRDDMLELIGNLLDNAWRHAERRVRLQILAPTPERACWRIQVDDDGAGVDAAALQQLSARGLRLDEQSEGSGLGLSICQAVVQSYDGRLVFAASKLGGLAVRAELPVG